jgi:hypothetical protein
MTTQMFRYITNELWLGIVSGHFSSLRSENLLLKDSGSYCPTLKIKYRQFFHPIALLVVVIIFWNVLIYNMRIFEGL